MSWPENVGIRAIETYFPSQYVDQTELETFDGASAGKYTVGLGQLKMGFCSDREDINSLALTVTKNLMQRYEIRPQDVGYLVVGTETIIDKSKSVKTALMRLFEPAGVTDLEGIDSTNACYGGTAALFHALNWIESSAWDGRLALVVCGDIAIYAKGSARPTGGAGAVAMLVGPDAALVVDRGLRSTFMKDVYDFYKPDLSSEYPVVDGKLSIQCYFNALDECYRLYRTRHSNLNKTAEKITLDSFDAVVFHTPFCKLVQKSFARMGFNDFREMSAEEQVKTYPGLAAFANVKVEETYSNRDLEQATLKEFNAAYDAKTKRSLILASNVGNTYTASVYFSLVSHLVHADTDSLAGNKIAVFSYGSGLAASMYTITVTRDAAKLKALKDKISYVMPLLESREKVSPEDFTKLMEIREKNNHAAPYAPCGSTEALFPGTFYLNKIDEKHRRSYERA